MVNKTLNIGRETRDEGHETRDTADRTHYSRLRAPDTKCNLSELLLGFGCLNKSWTRVTGLAVVSGISLDHTQILHVTETAAPETEMARWRAGLCRGKGFSHSLLFRLVVVKSQKWVIYSRQTQKLRWQGRHLQQQQHHSNIWTFEHLPPPGAKWRWSSPSQRHATFECSVHGQRNGTQNWTPASAHCQVG